MSNSENKATIRAMIAAFNEACAQGDFARVGQHFAPDVAIHDGPEGVGPTTGIAGLLRFWEALHAAFPDWQITIDALIAEGDQVVLRYTGRGTHRGPFMGIPATQRPVTLRATEIYRLAGGTIVEEWPQADQLGVLRQLGALDGVAAD